MEGRRARPIQGAAVSVCPYQDANVFRDFLSIHTLFGPLQAYGDSQVVVGYTNHEEDVANVLRLLYHVLLLSLDASGQFVSAVPRLESFYRSFPHLATAARRRHDRRLHKNKE